MAYFFFSKSLVTSNTVPVLAVDISGTTLIALKKAYTLSATVSTIGLHTSGNRLPKEKFTLVSPGELLRLRDM